MILTLDRNMSKLHCKRGDKQRTQGYELKPIILRFVNTGLHIPANGSDHFNFENVQQPDIDY